MKVEFDMYCGKNNIYISCPPSPKQKLKFWFCYVEGQGTPSHKHRSLEDAQREAERLAKGNYADVFVLEASKVCRYIPPLSPPPYVQWQDIINFNEKEGE